MNRLKRSMYVCLLAIVLTTFLLTAKGVKASGLSCNWKVVPSSNVGSNSNSLNGVAAVSASDIWTVGYYSTSGGIPQTLIEHWNGTSWKVVPSPNVGTNNNSLNGVAAVSTHDVWTVGYYLNSMSIARTLIERWNGTSWKVVTSPNVGTNNNSLSGVAVVSASDIWAVGVYSTSIGIAQTLIEHWNGTSWKVVASPNVGSSDNDLFGAVTISTSDIWAVGYYYSVSSNLIQTLIERWNGTTWKVVASSNVGTTNNSLNGVAAVSGSDIWTVGFYFSTGNFIDQTLIEHWNGTSWKVVPSPNPGTNNNGLFGVATVSASNIWAVGYYTNSVAQTLIEHWNGTNWKVVPSPNVGTSDNVLNGVTRIPRSSNVWAEGSFMSSKISQTLTEFYC